MIRPVYFSILPAAALIVALMFATTPATAHGPEGEFGGPVPASAGPFALTDHHGNPVTTADFSGQYLMVIFGYTFCPDFCPLELQTAAAVMDELGPMAARVQPLFITLDPERDTPEIMAEFVRHFHPKLIGLTGTWDEIHQAADGYGVWFEKTAVLKTPDGPIYFVSHTALNYIVGPSGKILEGFPAGTGPEEIAAALRMFIGAADARGGG